VWRYPCRDQAPGEGYADLEEVLKGPRGAALQGSTHIKEALEKANAGDKRPRAQGDWNTMRRAASTGDPGAREAVERKRDGSVNPPQQAPPHQVGVEEIAEVVSRSTGIPVSKDD